MSNRRFKRFWLQPNANDSVDSYVVVRIYNNETIDLKIADCTRTITLDFGYGEFSELRSKKQALAKLSRLQSAVDLIRETLEKSE